MHEHGLGRPTLDADLANGLEERQRLDVTHGAADFHQANVRALGGHVDTALDLVGDVRNHLHGGTQIIAAALLADHVLVDAAGGHRMAAGQARAHEALVVPKIEVGFGAVIGHVDLAVLERTHGARIHVDVGIQLHQGDLEAAGFKNGRQRGRRNALAKRGHHPAGNEDEGSNVRGRHGEFPR